jgi:hypothetical protein
MEIILEEIKNGLSCLSDTWCCFLFESCVISLSRKNHSNKGTVLKVFGDSEIEFKLTWQDIINDQIERTWNNQLEATEFGAECISMLLILRLTDYTIIRRSKKSDGFDYYLGNKNDNHFQNQARLEISGIFNGDKNEINNRFKIKLKQTAQSDYLKLPAFISVVEFSNPIVKFGKKNEY